MKFVAVWIIKSTGLVPRGIRAAEDGGGAANHTAVEFVDDGLVLNASAGGWELEPATLRAFGRHEWAARWELGVSDEAYAAMLLEARRIAGSPYGWINFARFPWWSRTLLRFLRIVHVSTRRLVCSAGTERVLRVGNVGFVHRDIPEGRVTPQMLHGSVRKELARGMYFGDVWRAA